jgi:hypothetical protein
MATSAIIARPGHGKSFVCTSIARRNLARGRRVFANYTIKGATLFTLDELADLPPGVVIIDEAASWFHSRRWNQMGDELLGKWNQTRKAGWELFIATQHEANLDTVIRRNIQYGWLLEARWSNLTVFDPRVRAAARIATARAREEFALLVEQEVFPATTKPPKVRPVEEAHPLYVYGRQWDFEHFRKTTKGIKPLARKRWWWSWDTAMAYDTYETLDVASSKEKEKNRART